MSKQKNLQESLSETLENKEHGHHDSSHDEHHGDPLATANFLMGFCGLVLIVLLVFARGGH